MCACGPAGAAHGLSLVAAEIVEDHDVSLGEGGHENFLDIKGEELAVDRPVDDPGCVDPVAVQGGGQGFSSGRAGPAQKAAGRAAPSP